jgi:alpha-methylacyl-CoA racemase
MSANGLAGPASDAPLAGVRIVDLSRMAPGPFATMFLGDWGADVITVEAPPRLDGIGQLPLHDGSASRELGVNPLYRSRRSIVVDAKQPDGREMIQRLADGADVFVEGFRPGVCERLGLGYEELARRNPRLIYCSITGYGGSGADARRAAHDINYLADAGVLATTTRGAQAPGIPINVVADHAAGGLYAALGILLALRGRGASGRGTHVDVSMLAGLLHLNQVVPAWIEAGGVDPSWGGGLLSGGAPFYDCYRTRDGRWISVGAIEPKFFSKLCARLDRPELAALQADDRRWDELRAALEERFAEKVLVEWEELLEDPDLCVAPVRSIDEAFTVWRERGVFTTQSSCGPLLSAYAAVPGPVVRYPGEHTRQVLNELGVADADVERLIRAGAVEAAATDLLAQ